VSWSSGNGSSRVISVVVGNPKPRSRTLRVAESVASRVRDVAGIPETETIDIANVASSLLRWPDPEGVIAVPVMTGGAPQHAMAPDAHLRPLLIELGASTPTSSLFFPMDRFEQADEVIDEWAERNMAVPKALRTTAVER
jgi:FMN reductase